VCAVVSAPAVVCTKSQGTLRARTLNIVHPDLSVSRSIGVIDRLTDVSVHRQQLTLVPATVFLRRLPATGGRVKLPPGISRVLEHIARKFKRLPLHFRGQQF